MKILIMGNSGSSGKRYISILKMLGAEIEIFDIQHVRNNRKIPKLNTAIIATPTHLHVHHIKELLEIGYKKILIESPVSKEIEEIHHIIEYGGDTEITMCCNWKFCSFSDLRPGSHKIVYNYFNHGNDTEQPIFDLCQLLYLNDGMMLDYSFSSPFFNVSIDGFHIYLSDIEQSYYRMISTWIARPEKMFSLYDALKATKKCLKYLDP